MLTDTRDTTQNDDDSPFSRVPGAVVVFSGCEPVHLPIAFEAGRLQLGRAAVAMASLRDDRLSRQHAEIRIAGERWIVRDLHSRNGTFVDGVEVRDAVEVA